MLMMVSGGPVSLSMCKVPPSITQKNCTGYFGTSSSPIDGCYGTPTVESVTAVQVEFWQTVFGTNETPNVIYDLMEGTKIDGPGDYTGISFYGVPFAIHVYDEIKGSEQSIDGKIVGWSYVFARVTGPTGIPADVILLSLTNKDELKEDGYHREGKGRGGFSVIGRMSSNLSNGYNNVEKAKNAIANATQDQQDCADACERTRAGAKAVADAALTAAIRLAGGQAAAAIAACCVVGKAAGPWGLLLGGLCLIGALIYFTQAVKAAQAIHAGAITALVNAYLNCLQGCGIKISEH
jgi:hypothetical protein